MWRDSRNNAALLLAAVAFLLPAAGLAARQAAHNARYVLSDRVTGSTDLERPPLVALNVETADGRRLQAQLEQQLHQGSFRSQQAASTTSSWSRRLLADQTFRVAYSSASAVCPSSSSADWAAIPGYGHLVSDNWVCSNTNTSRRLHGGSAQDFGSSRPNWASYGWAAFAVPAAPVGSPLTLARLEGLNLLVLGNQGLGGVGNCSVDAVDIAIYTNSNGAPDSKVHSVALQLPGDVGNSQTFTWNSNVSSVLSFDIVDRHSVSTSADPPALQLDFGTTYWLRVQLAANYRGNTGTAKCIVNWVLNNATKTGYNSLWQETVGGAAGYSTTCAGAATGALPLANQTFHSCFNGAVPGSTSTRRCLTYRNTASNPISCPAQFLDYSFAFYGNNAVRCLSAPSVLLSNGSWPSSCANTLVGTSCSANCTWGGTASTVCLVTGEWSTTVTGQCADPPTNCSGVPTAALTNGTWPGGCAGKLIGDTCTASCQFGGSATVTCQYGGTWSASTTGTCNDPPTNCTGLPTSTLSNGSWPSSCAGTLVGQSCSANCTWGGTASATCSIYGNWSSSITGQCADPPTNCSGVPAAALTNGTWPGSCAGKLIGDTCTASCQFGGSAAVTCDYGGTWSATSTGTCNDPPTSCTGVPTATLSNGSWPSSCAGTLVGQSCSANCTWGGAAFSTCTIYGNWSTSVTGQCADPPTNCSGVPTAALTNGTWPGGCAGKLIGDTCTASCQFGGSATVTCEYGGTWSVSTTGTCNDPPTNCTGVPSVTLSNGSWPSSCAGTIVGQSCSANCTWGGTAFTVCLATGGWSTSVTGQCADPPTNCTSVPTAALTSGTWPAACAQRLVGQTCSATCIFGGSATVTCLSTGQWEATVTGSCTAGPTNCSNTPSTKPDYGSWPASCDQTLVGSSCQATCTYGGTVTSLCKTDGTWQTASGSCTPGATAFVSDSGLGSSDKLWTCTLTGGTFSSCTSTADNVFNAVRGTFSDGSTVWAADAAGSGGGDIYGCSINAQTNVLSGCTAITSWGGYSGTRAPSGVVVKSGVAFIANDVANGGSNCPVLQCTTATATSIGGCTCLSATGILSGADGIAISPDGTKLYVTGTVQTVLTVNTPGIAVCTLTGTAVGSCNKYTFSSYASRSLTGLYANGTHVFTFASGLLGAKVLMCDGTAPAESSCADGITISSSVLASNTGPWGMSQFDGLYYVPDGDKFQRCSDVSGTGTCGSPLTLVGLLSGLTNLNAGINSIFVYPRI